MTDRDHSPNPKSDALSADEAVEVGRYQLLGRIGHGGMGEVFEAWDPQLERRVALKILLADGDDELALREARFLARVSHPNVVAVHEVGRGACGRLAPERGALVYIAMEYVDGPDLRRWLARGPRRWTDVLDAVIAAGQGLAAVHRSGLIHGDVKPQNVLVGGDGRVRIADFGLARVRSRAVAPELAASVRQAVAAEIAALVETERDPLYELGSVGDGFDSPAADVEPNARQVRPGGTAPYMAPECLSGQRSPRPQADQYSLCAMAWEALLGVRPFAGRSASTLLTAIALGQLERGRRPRGMPLAIVRVLRRGLSERREDRWPSVEALLTALERARRPSRSIAAFGLAGAAAGLVAVVGLTRPADRGLAVVGQAADLSVHDGSAAEDPVPVSKRGAVTTAGQALALASAASLDIDVEEAERSLDSALRALDRGGWQAPGLRVELLLARARIYEIGGHFDARWRDLEAAFEITEASPQDVSDELVAWARVALGLAALRRGQCARADTLIDSVRTADLGLEATRALVRAMWAQAGAGPDEAGPCASAWTKVHALAEFIVLSRPPHRQSR